jgi:hypothetical protein
MDNKRLILEWVPAAYRETGETANAANIKSTDVKPVLYQSKRSFKQLGFRRGR